MATSLTAQQAQHRFTTHNYKQMYETYRATHPLSQGWGMLLLQQDRSMFAVVYESPGFVVAYQAYAGGSREEVVIVKAKHGCVKEADAERVAREVFDGLLPPSAGTSQDWPEDSSEWQFPLQEVHAANLSDEVTECVLDELAALDPCQTAAPK